MPRRIVVDSEENEHWILKLVDFVFSDVGVVLILLLFLVASVVWSWLTELPAFENKTDVKTLEINVPVQFVLNYQTFPQVVYFETVVQGELEHKTTSNWSGDVISEECLILAQISAGMPNDLIVAANTVLSQYHLPLQFEQRGVNLNKTVDCSNNDYSHQVYIEVTGAEGSGDLLYIRKGGFDHEEAFVTLPRNLYDLVLLSAVNQTQFEMPNYDQVGWYGGQKLATVTYEVGDTNGLNAWVQSMLPVMRYAYGTSLVMTTPETVEIEVVVGSKKIKVGERIGRDCNYKGVCKRVVEDVFKYVDVTEMRQVTTIEYYIP